VITLPSVFAIGQKDPWREESKDMATKYFDAKTSKVVEFDTGHHLPTVKADTVRLSNAILNLYYSLVDDF